MKIPVLHPNALILAVTVFMLITGNMAFVSNTLNVYPPTGENAIHLVSLIVLVCCLYLLLFSLLSPGPAIRWVMMAMLLISSVAAYFMDSFNIIIDQTMVLNVASTDAREVIDLLNLKLLSYVLLLGVLPALLVYRVPLQHQGLVVMLLSRLKLAGISLLLIIIIIYSFGDFYGSFFREQKQLRGYMNPLSSIYASLKYLRNRGGDDVRDLVLVAQDARLPDADVDRELVIFVVGETARADRFSLNGYARETNPLLAQEGVVSFTHVTSCGTSTAISVPCMFSIFDSDSFDSDDARNTENVLDIIKRTGANVIWRDNNSSSKGVADRVEYADFRNQDNNPVCDVECRDEGLLDGLREYIDSKPEGDIFIVLHQMGNHGPAYYKRYPKAFEKFTPVCATNLLEQCSKQELDNTYDNIILYTDYVLSRVIELLKEYDSKPGFEPAMVYVSDHGESLGENGLYLHGYPNMLAPDAQRHVPLIVWLGTQFDDIDMDALRLRADLPFSHDNVFHTVLGILEVETQAYDPEMNIFRCDPDHCADSYHDDERVD